MFRFRVSPALVLTAVLLAAPLARGAEVAGVKVDDRVRLGTSELALNGAGLRTRLFFKVYVAALYAPKKTSSAAGLIDAAEPRRMQLHLLRDMEAEALLDALNEGLRKNHTEAELAALASDLDRFAGLMRAIGNARSGDLITLDFSNDGTAVGFKGEARGSIPGAAFGRALLKVWLGDKPVDAGLKQALLGS